MRKLRYRWKDRLLGRKKKEKKKKKNFTLSLQNIVALPDLTAILPVKVPEPWFAMQQLQHQAVSDLCDLQRGVQRPDCLWRIQIILLHVLNPELSSHYCSHSLSRCWQWRWMNLLFNILGENVNGGWCTCIFFFQSAHFGCAKMFPLVE